MFGKALWQAIPLFAFVLPLPCIAADAPAAPDKKTDALALQKEEIDLIESMADRICNVVVMSGDISSSDVKGEVKVELNGLAKHLVDAGASGSAGLNSEHYAGVLRKDLASTVADNAACKLKVVTIVQDKILQPVAASVAVQPGASVRSATAATAHSPPPHRLKPPKPTLTKELPPDANSSSHSVGALPNGWAIPPPAEPEAPPPAY